MLVPAGPFSRKAQLITQRKSVSAPSVRGPGLLAAASVHTWLCLQVGSGGWSLVLLVDMVSGPCDEQAGEQTSRRRGCQKVGGITKRTHTNSCFQIQWPMQLSTHTLPLRPAYNNIRRRLVSAWKGNVRGKRRAAQGRSVIRLQRMSLSPVLFLMVSSFYCDLAVWMLAFAKTCGWPAPILKRKSHP